MHIPLHLSSAPLWAISHLISHLSSLISSHLISTGVPRGGRAARVPAAHRRGQLDEHRQARALPPRPVLTRSRRVPQPCPYVRGTRTGPRLLRRRAARPRAPRTVLSRRMRAGLGRTVRTKCRVVHHRPR
eukprot:scaffold92278_cov62-Phaeocystis_antarctica.AAC.8